MCAGAWPSIVRAGFLEERVPGCDVMQRRERTVGCSSEDDVTNGKGQAQGNCRRGLPSQVGRRPSRQEWRQPRSAATDGEDAGCSGDGWGPGGEAGRWEESSVSLGDFRPPLSWPPFIQPWMGGSCPLCTGGEAAPCPGPVSLTYLAAGRQLVPLTLYFPSLRS